MEKVKQERSEYVGIYVTPDAAKQLKDAGNNDVLKDKIIKDFIGNEITFLKDEIKEMDEVVLLYRAKLLTLRDSFSETQGIYVEEIEKLIEKTSASFSPIHTKFSAMKKGIECLKDEVKSVSDAIAGIESRVYNIDFSRLERLLDAVDRFNKMPDTEKELIRLLLNNDNK